MTGALIRKQNRDTNQQSAKATINKTTIYFMITNAMYLSQLIKI